MTDHKPASLDAPWVAALAAIAPKGRPGPEWFTIEEAVSRGLFESRSAADSFLRRRVEAGLIETQTGTLNGRRVGFWRIK